MKLRLVVVGKLKRGGERELCDDYLGRLKRYCAVEEIEIAPARAAADLPRAVDGANLVVLALGGRRLTSAELAGRLEGLVSRGKGVVAFAVGGADGLPSDIERAAAERWSLSDLTLPHRLARVVLYEQLYRAMTILRGEPYHH